MAPAALKEALVDVLPITYGLPGLVDRGEPQALAHGLEGAEVASVGTDKGLLKNLPVVLRFSVSNPKEGNFEKRSQAGLAAA